METTAGSRVYESIRQLILAGGEAQRFADPKPPDLYLAEKKK